MQAALYARVSTEKQKDEHTIETQLNEVKAAVQNDGNILLKENIYSDEGWSGAYIERPQLDLMRQDARLNKFEILYVYDKGRLSRKFVHQEVIIDELRNLSIQFKSLHDINGKSAEENVMGGVMGLFHEYERVKTAERFRLSKLNKVRSGDLLGYNAPYGYTYIPVSGKGKDKINGRFEIDKNEAIVVKKIFTWVGTEGISLREVIRRLHTEGISPKKEKRSSWTKGPVIRLLNNETYTGNHYYNKSESVLPKNPRSDRTHFKHTNKTSRKARDKSEWIPVNVPAIIDAKLFQAVQKQLSLNAKYASRNTKHEYLFGGLTYCSCGLKRTSEGARGHYYYRCTDRLHQFPEPRQCFEGSLNVQEMDSAVWSKLVIMLTEPKLLEQQFERYMANIQNQSTAEDINLQDAKKQLANLKAEEKRYISAYGRGSLDELTFDEYINDVKKRRNEISSKIDRARTDESKNIIGFNSSNIVEQFSSLLSELKFEEKLFTVRKIVDKVIATKEEITICGHIPLITPMTTEMAGLHAEYRYSWSTQRRQIYLIQCSN